MGHLIFFILHFIAILFGLWLLVLTLPLHLIYGATRSGGAKSSDEAAPSPKTHVNCPDCRELVRKDARKCKHCGTALVPTVSELGAPQPPGTTPSWLVWASIAGVILIVLLSNR